MAASDVIFNIGVAGAKAATADISAVVNVIKAMSSAILDNVAASQKFQQVVKAMQIDMGRFEADTKGLIDTMTSYQQANKLTQAGVQVTAEQMAALGKAAVRLAKDTGQDATQAFVRLTDSVAKGSSRALKEYGIDLENTEDLTLAQIEAVDKLTGKYKDQSVEIETLAEKTFSFQNTIGTLKDQLVAPAFEAFTGWLLGTETATASLTTALNDLSTAIFKGGQEMQNWFASGQGFANLAGGIWAEITGDVEEATLKAEEFYRAQQRGIEAERIRKQQMAEEQAGRENQRTLDAINAMEAAYDRKASSGRKGGGGRGRKKPDQIAMLTDRSMPDVPFSEGIGDLSGLLDVQTEAGLAAERAATIEASRQDAAFDAWMAGEQRKSEALQAELEKREAWQRMSDMERAQSITQTASFVGSAVGQWASVMDAESKRGFERAKALQMAQVAVDTPTAAIGAYAAMARIPYVGPALGAVAAANAIAFGVAQMANISRQKFNPKGGGSASIASSGGKSVPRVTSGNDYGAGAAGQSGTTVVNNITLDGQMIHSSVIKANDNAAQRGERSFSTEVR